MDKQQHVLTPTGDLSIFEAMTFRDALVAVLDQDKPRLLDLSQLGHVDAAGVQLLLAAERSGFTLTGINEQLRHTFQQIGILVAK